MKSPKRRYEVSKKKRNSNCCKELGYNKYINEVRGDVALETRHSYNKKSLVKRFVNKYIILVSDVQRQGIWHDYPLEVHVLQEYLGMSFQSRQQSLCNIGNQ